MWNELNSHANMTEPHQSRKVERFCSFRPCVATRSPPGICQFSTKVRFQYGSNRAATERKPKRKQTADTQPFHLHDLHVFKKISFFCLFSSGDTRRFPLRVSEITLNLSELFPNSTLSEPRAFLQTIVKYPLPSVILLAL